MSLDLAVVGENFDVVHFAAALDPCFRTNDFATGSAANRFDRLRQRHSVGLHRLVLNFALTLDMRSLSVCSRSKAAALPGRQAAETRMSNIRINRIRQVSYDSTLIATKRVTSSLPTYPAGRTSTRTRILRPGSYGISVMYFWP